MRILLRLFGIIGRRPEPAEDAYETLAGMAEWQPVNPEPQMDGRDVGYETDPPRDGPSPLFEYEDIPAGEYYQGVRYPNP